MLYGYEKEKDILLKYNCTNLNRYSLVNNNGWTFDLNGNNYDVRHWKNIYGVQVNYWKIDTSADDINIDILNRIVKDLNENCK